MTGETKFENCTFNNGEASPQRESTQLALAEAIRMNADAARQLAASLGVNSPIAVKIENNVIHEAAPSHRRR